MEKNKTKKIEIQELVDKRVREILEGDADKIETELFYKKLNQAKLGMVYVHDREVMKRISNGQMIRVINFITSNPDEKESYIRSSMPEIAPLQIDKTEKG